MTDRTTPEILDELSHQMNDLLTPEHLRAPFGDCDTPAEVRAEFERLSLDARLRHHTALHGAQMRYNTAVYRAHSELESEFFHLRHARKEAMRNTKEARQPCQDTRDAQS